MARHLTHRAREGVCGMRYVVVALLLVLVACSPGGAPSGGPVAANYAGYWVVSTGTAFYKLDQSGSEVTGRYYHTLERQSLALADYVYECGVLGGQVSGRTLTLEVIRTSQNCPTVVDAGREIRATVTGQVQGDSFSGTVSWTRLVVVGGIEQVEETGSYSTEWENVEPTDRRVQYDID